MNLSDSEQIAELIEGCLNGNRKWQKVFYEAFYTKMMGVCYRYSKNTEEAKDVFHDGFLKALENLG